MQEAHDFGSARTHSFTVRRGQLTHPHCQGNRKDRHSHWGTEEKYETKPIPNKPITIIELQLVLRPAQARLAKGDVLIHGQSQRLLPPLPKRRHASLKFLTREPSTRSPYLDHLPSPRHVTLGP